MTKPVRLDAEAVEELASAHARYEAVVGGLGEELADEVSVALARIQEQPRAYPLTPAVPRALGVRRALLRRFPFAIVYLELGDEIRVLAIAHQRRRPGYWRRRLRRGSTH